MQKCQKNAKREFNHLPQQGSRRNPAKRFRWEEDERQRERVLPLKGIGSNINRLTVLANMGKVQVIALEKAAGELSEVSAALRAVMEGR